jgi:DNA-binding PadR family transcriptional regulator
MAIHLTIIQFIILTALAEGPSHGYVLQGQVQGETFGHYMRSGTISKCLTLMERKGWVQKVSGLASDGPARTTYMITPHGKSLLRSHAVTMRDVGTLALKRVG